MLDENWLQTFTEAHFGVTVSVQPHGMEILLTPDRLLKAVGDLKAEWVLAGVMAEEDRDRGMRMRYLFYGHEKPWLALLVKTPGTPLPSISKTFFAADWQEREIEDLFDIRFEGHPQLGNFVLHNEDWPEKTAPMRQHPPEAPLQNPQWEDVKLSAIVEAPGAFVMPIGPVYSGVSESVQFNLETVGEEIIFAHIRPFYKYRAAEKVMEGKNPQEAMLVAERIDGLAAFAHSLAFCQAVEQAQLVPVPPKVRLLRIFWAEFERIRAHVGTLAAIIESTGLGVPANLMLALEEELLQLSAIYTGHRYLFGLNRLGGLSLTWREEEIRAVTEKTGSVVNEALEIAQALIFDNSFMDRLEFVGILSLTLANTYGLVGPVGRASGRGRDLRQWQPYSGYEQMTFHSPVQTEGDGYARFRQFGQEIAQSLALLQQIPGSPPKGPAPPFGCQLQNTALGYCEGPAGAIIYALRMDEGGRVRQCRIITPSMINWHAFPQAVRHFTFQDFPIILATFGLSVAELDR